MGLMKFLSAGRSFVGLGSGSTRYKTAAESVVPNFAKKPSPRGGKRPAKSPETHKNGHVGTVGDGVPQTKLKVKATALPLASAAVTGVADVTGPSPRKETRLLAPPVAAIVAPAPEVQTELHLGTVKVARNDLSDADLEVVVATETPPAVASPGKAEGFVKKLKMTRMVRACLAWF